jgi:hypothetical protein
MASLSLRQKPLGRCSSSQATGNSRGGMIQKGGFVRQKGYVARMWKLPQFEKVYRLLFGVFVLLYREVAFPAKVVCQWTL